MRHLDEDARAVARVRLAAARAAMVEVHKNLQGVAHHLVRLLALHIDDEPQSARIVFELWIIKALFRRRAQAHRGGVISFLHLYSGERGTDESAFRYFLLNFYNCAIIVFGKKRLFAH
jgi:hypothetical protein